MSSAVLIEPHYLPSLEYFCCIWPHENLLFEGHEHYVKQTYRNRCYIQGPNNVLPLTIPVINGNSKISMKEIKIDYSQRWAAEHWRSIQSAYGKAPYFEFFADYFEKEFHNRSIFLIDFTERMLTLCLKLIKTDKKIEWTNTYQKEYKEGIIDFRSVITPKMSYTKRQIYKSFSYMQVFGKDFEENLSIIDLLMNEGPNASLVVTKSIGAE
jgi:hypothetical protein